MAYRAVNSLQLSRDDMRRVYREQAGNYGRSNGVRIGHIIKILDILVPILPHFFRSTSLNANANVHTGSHNRRNMGYDGEDGMSGSGRYGHAHSGRYGHGMSSGNDLDICGYGGNGMSHANVRGNCGMARPDDIDNYVDRVISEEEFERLLDYAEQNNVRMY